MRACLLAKWKVMVLLVCYWCLLPVKGFRVLLKCKVIYVLDPFSAGYCQVKYSIVCSSFGDR